MKKLLLVIIIFLLAPIIVNAESYLCKYELDVEGTNTERASWGDDVTTEVDNYLNSFKNITKIEVLREERDSNFTISFSYYVNGNELKAASLESYQNEGNEYHRIDGQYLVTNYRFDFDYFNSYINRNSECLSNIYIYPMQWGADQPPWMTAHGRICVDEDYCGTNEPFVKYKLKTQGNPIIDPENPATKECTDKNLNCQKIDAISCRKYLVRANKFGEGHIELGTLDDGDRYIAVVFEGYPVGIFYDTGTNYSVKIDNYTFQIDKSFWDKLVLDKCNYENMNLAFEETETPTGIIAKIVQNKSNSKPTIPIIEIPEVHFCAESRVLQAFKIAGFLLFALKIIVPLIIIILGSIDFAKAVLDTGDKSNKEALNMLVKRLIIGIIIFLLPTILDVLLGFVDGAKETSVGFSTCTNCLFNPFSSECEQNITGTRGVVGHGGTP